MARVTFAGGQVRSIEASDPREVAYLMLLFGAHGPIPLERAGLLYEELSDLLDCLYGGVDGSGDDARPA